MERLKRTSSSGLTANALRTWGMLFLIGGIAGRSIIQNRLLGIGTLTNQRLLREDALDAFVDVDFVKNFTDVLATATDAAAVAAEIRPSGLTNSGGGISAPPSKEV